MAELQTQNRIVNGCAGCRVYVRLNATVPAVEFFRVGFALVGLKCRLKGLFVGESLLELRLCLGAKSAPAFPIEEGHVLGAVTCIEAQAAILNLQPHAARAHLA